MALVSSNSLSSTTSDRIFCIGGPNTINENYRKNKSKFKSKFKLRGILLTMYDKRNKLSSQVEKEARDYFKEKVYTTVIPRNVRLLRSTVTWYARS